VRETREKAEQELESQAAKLGELLEEKITVKR